MTDRKTIEKIFGKSSRKQLLDEIARLSGEVTLLRQRTIDDYIRDLIFELTSECY